MSLYRPDELTGFVHADAPELDRKLREGDGLHWTGDPRLELRMGIIQANQRVWVDKLGRYVVPGEIIMRRYEVWRHNEDGTDTIIGHWRLEEYDRILVDLAPVRLDSPNHIDTLAAIDAHNDEIEKANDTKMRDAVGEALSHQLSVWHDRHNPKNVFRQMPGRNPEKQL